MRDKISNIQFNKIIFVLLVITSVGGLFINKGLYYFELNSNIEVKVTGDFEDINNFNNSVQSQNLVRIDKLNNILYFENSSFEQVSSLLNSLNSEQKVNLQISRNIYERDETLKNYTTLVLVLILSTTLMLLYFILKNKSKLDSKKIFYLISSYLITAFFSNLFLAGCVSLLSRYYQIRELDITSFLFMNLWLSTIFFILVWRIIEINFDDMSSIYASTDFYHKKYNLILILIILLVTFGLGINFIITALLTIVGVIFVSLSFNNLGNILKFNLRRIREIGNKVKAAKPGVPSLINKKPSSNLVKPSPGKKKKSKSRKKKK